MTKKPEQLFTCPKCQQPNFTARGLKTHNCERRIAASAQVITEPAMAEKFSPLRRYSQMAKVSIAQGAAFMILAGAEVLRLKKELGETRGGDHSKTANVGSFADLVEKHAGIPYRTAHRYEQMFHAAKKRVPALNAKELLETPLGDLPELKQRELLDSVRKVVPDGATAQQIMWDFGIAKKPRGSGATGGHRPSQNGDTSPEDSPEQAAIDLWTPTAEFLRREIDERSAGELPRGKKGVVSQDLLLTLVNELAAQLREIMKGSKE